MGAGIAQVFLAAGIPVVLHDAAPDRLEGAVERIHTGLERAAQKGLLPDAEAAFALLEPCPNLPGTCAADWIIEAIAEDAAAKEDLFASLGRLAPPEAVLASNTSSISLTRLARAGGRPERTIGMHFFNPPPVMELVEVIPALQTAHEVLEATHALARRLGKTPVTAADRPGFIANRLLAPFLNEAIWALEEGVGTPEAIDQVARLGLRHPMGPLQLADFIGLDVLLAILEVLHREFGDPKYRPCPRLRRLVEAGHLGRKTGEGFHSYGE